MSDFAQDFRLLSSMVEPVDVKITVKKDPEKPYVGLENMPSREARLLGWESASSSISTNSVFSIGDVLFGKLRPNLRKCVVAPFDGYCSTDILVLRAKEGVDSGFAGKIFQTEQVGVAAERTAIGTKMPRTSWGHLKEVSVFCPEIEEQKLIAQILDTLDTAIHETEALIDKLKAVKQGLLHDLLTRGIDANGQLRPPQSEAPQLYKESPLGWIPREWEVSALSELGIGGLINGVFKEPGRVGSGVPLVNVADLYRGESVNLDECERFAATDIESSRYSAQPGDIFFTRSSLKLEGIAQTSYLANAADSAVFECHVMRLRPNITKVAPRYLKEWCIGLHARKHFMANAKQVTMTTISQDGIASLDCPQPPLAEQIEAVRRMEAIDTSLNCELVAAKKLKDTKVALMDDLLTGRVRVTALLESVQQVAAQTEA